MLFPRSLCMLEDRPEDRSDVDSITGVGATSCDAHSFSSPTNVIASCIAVMGADDLPALVPGSHASMGVEGDRQLGTYGASSTQGTGPASEEAASSIAPMDSCNDSPLVSPPGQSCADAEAPDIEMRSSA